MFSVSWAYLLVVPSTRSQAWLWGKFDAAHGMNHCLNWRRGHFTHYLVLVTRTDFIPIIHRSTWWLQMTWCHAGARPSATIMLNRRQYHTIEHMAIMLLVSNVAAVGGDEENMDIFVNSPGGLVLRPRWHKWSCVIMCHQRPEISWMNEMFLNNDKPNIRIWKPPRKS